MHSSHRWVLLGVVALPLLAACGSSSVGTESGSIAPPVTAGSGSGPKAPVTPPKASVPGTGVAGTDNAVAATSSLPLVSVTSGASQAVSITFTSNDGHAISGFAISGSLATLPAGWSGPNNFSCGAVGPGSGCVLTLMYAPMAVDSGSFTLNCVFVDNAGLPRTPGPCATVSYAATTPNNVAAYASPSGEVDAIVGSSKQAVNVNFTTDDGSAATNLVVDTSGWPAGWSSTVGALSCAIVSTGSGCHLPLSYAPTAAGGGTFTLNFSYTDNSGTAKTAAINIPYAAVSHDTVVANAAPLGQINAAINGSRTVAVTFTTDDGNAASSVSVLSDLSKLPAGWSSSGKTFSCASAGTGNGCQLQLSFAPTALGGGTLLLNYAYIDSSGASNVGSISIDYAATTNDNVVATASPSGQINAMQGAPGQPVAVTFATDDARLATALKVTSDLTALPPGWSTAASSFTCTEVLGGASCQLMLSYAPAAFDNGTLMLNFSYINNAGQTKSGALAIPYRTTSNDNIVGTATPNALSVLTGSSNGVAVTFVTDDGNLAGPLAADLSALPADWSAASSAISCASVSTGTSCQFMLNFAPTAAANSTLSFGFTYTNASGTSQSGTVSIPYVAALPPPPPPPGP
jgi:hypothetical protein